MNRIKTSDVLDPSIQQPFTAPSLAFLQTATRESLAALVSAICPSILIDMGNPIIIFGGEIIPIGGTVYSNQPAYIYLDNEIFLMPSVIYDLSGGTVGILNIATTNDLVADPVEFSDGVSRNVHNVRRITLGVGASGSGLYDLSEAAYLADYNLNNMSARGFAQATMGNYSVGGTTSKVKFTGETVDVSNYYDATLSRYTPLKAGYYRVTAHFQLAADSSFSPPGYDYYLTIYKNGVQSRQIDSVMLQGSDLKGSLTGSGVVYCNGSTDYLEVYMQTGTSGPTYSFSNGGVEYMLEAL